MSDVKVRRIAPGFWVAADFSPGGPPYGTHHLATSWSEAMRTAWDFVRHPHGYREIPTEETP